MKQRPKYRNLESYRDVSEDSYEGYEETEMITKSSSDKSTTEVEVKDGDTLQSLSLRYHCTVAELKRLNNLYRENEIFARRTLKVPYRIFSMAAVHKSGDNSPETNLLKNSIDANILKQKLSSVSLMPSTSKNTQQQNGCTIVNDLVDLNDSNINNFNDIIFNTTLKSNAIETEHNNFDNIDNVSDEEVQLLPNNAETIREPQATIDYSCNGADWGISWPILLGVILIIGLVGPFIYYIIEHSEKYHHHQTHR